MVLFWLLIAELKIVGTVVSTETELEFVVEVACVAFVAVDKELASTVKDTTPSESTVSTVYFIVQS